MFQFAHNLPTDILQCMLPQNIKVRLRVGQSIFTKLLFIRSPDVYYLSALFATFRQVTLTAK